MVTQKLQRVTSVTLWESIESKKSQKGWIKGSRAKPKGDINPNSTIQFQPNEKETKVSR